MATPQQLAARIAKLDAEIEAGIEETVVDGTKVRVSIAAKQKQRTRLERRLRQMKRGSSMIRPFNLGGF